MRAGLEITTCDLKRLLFGLVADAAFRCVGQPFQLVNLLGKNADDRRMLLLSRLQLLHARGKIFVCGQELTNPYEGPDDEEAGGHAAAGALIDAIHSKDAAAVYDAMKGMSAFMKPAGEDDMEMAPDSAEGALIPSGEG